MAIIKPEELQVGDALLVHSDAWLSKAIQYFSDSQFNHVASFHESRNGKFYLAQAAANGYVEAEFADALGDALYVEVFRCGIENSPTSGQPYIDWILPDTLAGVKAAMESYLHDGDAYAYNQLVELALVCEVRRISGSIIWRNLVDRGFQWVLSAIDAIPIVQLIESFIGKGKELLICSEAEFREKKIGGFIPEIISSDLYGEYKNLADKGAVITAFDAQKILQDGINPNFVTPGDIAMSPNYISIGKLQYGNLQTT